MLELKINHADHQLLVAKANQAGMSVPTYIRHLIKKDVR